MLFSKRHGYVKVRDCIQFESIDEITRNHLWTIYYLSPIWIISTNRYNIRYNDMNEALIRRIWIEIFNAPVDAIPPDEEAVQNIRKTHLQGKWHVVFDILEVISEWLRDNNSYKGYLGNSINTSPKILINAESFYQKVNALFERECVGYRLIDSKVCPITDALEIEQIELAVNAKPSPAQTHIQRALELLSNRKQPDYRNSIKESISAVESTAKTISSSEKGTLGDLLKRMDLHGGFQQGLSKIYGYTSDADGIRHALMNEPAVTFADAKFFLVMCASFINYLHDKNSTAK